MTSYTTVVTLLLCSLQFVTVLATSDKRSCQSSVQQIQNAIKALQAASNGLNSCCNGCCTTAPDPCDDDIIAYYPFDRSFRDVCHGYNGFKEGIVSLEVSSGLSNGAAFFKGNGKIRVARLNGFKWGSMFSVSLFFKRTGSISTYQGLINNGYYKHGSWEIRMGREQSGQMLGGGVITQSSTATWDYVGLTATFDHWHHVVMTYNGTQLDFYLDNVKQVAKNPNCCQGDIVTKNTDVVIGQAGPGMSKEYFYGYIDEVKLFKKALTAKDVQKLYQLKNL